MARSRWQVHFGAALLIAIPVVGALLAVSVFDAQLGSSLQIAGSCDELLGHTPATFELLKDVLRLKV